MARRAKKNPVSYSMLKHSAAMEAAITAIHEKARRTAVIAIKNRAKFYALSPDKLANINDRLVGLQPENIIARLELINQESSGEGRRRWVGFGGEVPAINLRGAMLYARWRRAKENMRT